MHETETEIHQESPLLAKARNRLNDITNKVSELNNNNGLLVGADINFPDIELSPDKQMANAVFNALGQTLKNTSELCLNKKENLDTYIEVSEVITTMLGALTKIGEGSIRFKENTQAEKVTKEKFHDEELYIFETGPLDINGVKIEKLKILIRPTDTVIDKYGTVRQIAQARTKITIISRDLPHGEASIRIDPPDPRKQNNIIFDLAIGEGKKTTIDSLDLDQSAGHHFQSGVNVTEFGELDIANIHRAIVRRLMELS